MPTFCKGNFFLRSVRIAALLFCSSLLSTVMLQAQTDPGPRPVGKVSSNPNFQVCPINSAKFPGAFNNTRNDCIDTVQPSPDPNNPVTGAGNVILNGGTLTGLWFEALTVFETQGSVGPGPQTGGSTIPGLGPSFNAISCFGCHSQPTVGGSSPNTATPGFPHGNPQTQIFGSSFNAAAPNSTQLAALTTAPTGFNPILTIDSAGNGTGPVREVRFISGFAGDPTNSIDPVLPGAVANLFAITSGIGAPNGCVIGQEPFQTELQNHNVIFRIPIPTFGEGFVENTDDGELERNAGLASSVAGNLGITDIKFGGFNRSGNDQTITRFGWKAQNKSMLIFSGEAGNVEMGVTNENFPNERTQGNGKCELTDEPNDQIVVPPDPTDPAQRPIGDKTVNGVDIGLLHNFGPSGVASDISSDIENFAVFMRLNAAPSQCAFNSKTDSTGAAQCFSLTCAQGDTTCSVPNPNPSAADVASIKRGKKLFGSLDSTLPGSLTSNTPDGDPVTSGITSIGCVLCHSDSLTTSTSQAPSLSNQKFVPFSDFALHTMDANLADGVGQGIAKGQQFRTAPLWGIGQRLFFLHDGRRNDLLNTIKDHCQNASAATPSEACEVIGKFNGLSAASQQDLLNFLRSL